MASELRQNSFSLHAWTWVPTAACPWPLSPPQAPTVVRNGSCSVFHEFHVCFHCRGLAFTVSSCPESSGPSATLLAFSCQVTSFLSAACSQTLPGVLSHKSLITFTFLSLFGGKTTSQVTSGLLVYKPGAVCHLCALPSCVTVYRSQLETNK